MASQTDNLTSTERICKKCTAYYYTIGTNSKVCPPCKTTTEKKLENVNYICNRCDNEYTKMRFLNEHGPKEHKNKCNDCVLETCYICKSN